MMIMAGKKVLLFGFGKFADGVVAAGLQRRMEEMGISVARINKNDYKVPLGILVSLAGTGLPVRETAARIPDILEVREYEDEELPVRILLFAGFNSEDLDEVLVVCRECGIGRNDLKAVLTPDNALWDVPTLCRELTEEHRMMNP